MRHKTALAFALLVIIVVSAVALIAQEKNCNIKITFIASDAVPAFHSAPNLENSNGAASFSLTSNTTRTQIYSYIVSNPGVQFRGICMGLGVAVGTAEFHLGILKKAGLISYMMDGKYKRYFAAKKFTETQMRLISLLRHRTPREILKTLATEKTVTHGKLAYKLSITSQGLTWQMNRLRTTNLIQSSKTSLNITYSIDQTQVLQVTKMLAVVENL